MSEPTNESTHTRPDEDYASRIVEFLGGLPAGQKIAWNDPPADNDMFHGHVDAWAPLVCHPLKIGWAWTIAGEPTGDDGPLTIIVSPDKVVGGQPAWNVSTINRALEGWAAEHAQRSDVRFAVDVSLIPPLVKTLEHPLEEFLAEFADDDP